jgi:hypothetical protein
MLCLCTLFDVTRLLCNIPQSMDEMLRTRSAVGAAPGEAAGLYFESSEAITTAAVRNAARSEAVMNVALTPSTVAGLERIFDLIDLHHVHRVCFYHPQRAPFDGAPIRGAIGTIFRRTCLFAERYDAREVFTEGAPMDAAFAWLTLERQHSPLAYRAYRFLEWNAGSSAQGEGAAQVRGRCARCRFFRACRGGSRLRAAATGDPSASDPGCYLTDEEIGGPPI